MADPIEAHYTPDGDDWAVAVTGRGRTLTGRAPGLIAARDRADQLVEQLAPQETGHRTVVHMLNGDAVEFTTAYLTARLARSDEPADQAPTAQEPAAAQGTADGKPAAKAEQPGTSSTTPANSGTPAEGETRTEPTAPTQPRTPAAREVPAPPNAATGQRPAGAKPTPAPRTESDAAKPAVHPPAAETPKEETATSGT
jgi:hypothetical protein